MSEFEKQQREAYQKKRKKYIYLQAIIASVLVAATFILAFNYFKLDKATYVYYTQEGSVKHKAYLSDNEFYEEEYLNGSHAYVAELIKLMTAEFTYALVMDTENVSYKYTYKIDAQVQIKDSDTGMMIYDPVFELLPEQTGTAYNNSISINELATVDYHKYNRIAKDFVGAYGLDRTVNELAVRMYIDVVGASESFAQDKAEQYVIELYLPLMVETVNPTTVTSVPTEEQRILAMDTSSKNGLLIAFITVGAFALVVLAILSFYVVLTRDKHIDYARKVRRILSSYKSYIQKIVNPFDTEGYQVLYLSKFTEMLEIRDTLQMPILMYENDDKTCASFFIATGSKVLYLFEIKVEEDEVVECVEEPQAPVEEPSEAPVEEVAEEPVEEPMEKSEIIPEPEPVDDRIDVIDVVWPEHEGKANERLYRYDPDGETLESGDVVLVPSVDVHGAREITRNAKVKNGNYKMDPAKLPYPLKKIIGVVKRRS